MGSPVKLLLDDDDGVRSGFDNFLGGFFSVISVVTDEFLYGSKLALEHNKIFR